ncbi:MAG: hypothetical protein ACI9VR_002036 [Cognaticolwellia sp.]|jgi:hypothetical protein
MTPGVRPSGLNLPVLALAILLMLGVGTALSTSAVKLLRALGFFPPPREPVEVFYEPYSDGKRLEDLLGPDERPGELHVWEVEPATESALPGPEPVAEPPPDSPPPSGSPALPNPN